MLIFIEIGAHLPDYNTKICFLICNKVYTLLDQISGSFSKKPFFAAIREMGKTYGQLFRFPGIFDKPEFVIDLNPKDFSIIFHNEGTWPDRRVFDTFVYHRVKHRPEFFQGVEGIIST